MDRRESREDKEIRPPGERRAVKTCWFVALWISRNAS